MRLQGHQLPRTISYPIGSLGIFYHETGQNIHCNEEGVSTTDMDPLSISVAILAIIETTKQVIQVGFDVKDAMEERRALREDLETFSSLLGRLAVWCNDALSSHPDPDTPPPWLRGLWEVQPGSGHWENGVWVHRYNGSVAQFKRIIDEMSTKLALSTNSIKKSEIYQRATWHWKKDDFTKWHTDIAQCCAVMNTFFALKSDETQKKVLDSVEDYGENNKIQLSNIYSRLLESEMNQKREDERRRLEEAMKEREEITNWLSPLNFRGKQEKLWSTCLQETGDWLWQDPRFKVWAEGSPVPWYLKWFVFSP